MARYSVSVAFLNCSFLFHLSFGVHFYHSKNSLDNIFFQPKLPVSKILSDFLYQQIEFIQFATNTDLFTFQPFHHAPTMLNCGVMSVYSIQRRPELIIKLDNTRWVNHNSLTLNMHQASPGACMEQITREYTRDRERFVSKQFTWKCRTMPNSWPICFFFFLPLKSFQTTLFADVLFILELYYFWYVHFVRILLASSQNVWNNHELQLFDRQINCLFVFAVDVCVYGCFYFNVRKICRNRMKTNKFLEGRVSQRIQQKCEHRMCSKHFAKHAHFCT